MPPLLSLQNITAGYGGKAVINDICFDVCASEFCALLGLNGSGKTTLLKTICGLLPAISGKIIVSGEDCTELGEHKRSRHMSYILQRHSKLIGVTVMDAVLMGLNPNLGLFNYPTATDKARAEETLEKFGIAHLAGKDFSKLSEGQKQIVILTRTLIQDTPVMLMDEPDSALDFSNRHKTLKRIRKLIHSEKKAGLVTLHDPNLALVLRPPDTPRRWHKHLRNPP